MENMFTLLLSAVAAVLTLAAALLLLPRPVSLPVATQLSKARTNVVVVSVFYTVAIMLAGLLATGVAEVARSGERAARGDGRVDLVTTVDFLRAQVSCALCLLNLLLCLLLPALADAARRLDSAVKNLDAMKRQVKGLQTEYERVTKRSDGGASAGESEAAALKSKVDKLIRDQAEQQDAIDAAQKAKSGSDAKVEALLSQIKGFDKEYDRVLDENKGLQRRLAQLDATAPYRELNKKDD